MGNKLKHIDINGHGILVDKSTPGKEYKGFYYFKDSKKQIFHKFEEAWADSSKKSVKFEENELGRWDINYWKPNIFQRFMYWIGLMKDPRYNGKKLNKYFMDEFNTWTDPNLKGK